MIYKNINKLCMYVNVVWGVEDNYNMWQNVKVGESG